MRIQEISKHESKRTQIKKFADWAMKKLKIKDMPEIMYSDDITKVKDHRAYGSTNSNGEVWVHVGNRTVADAARTLVHELIHVKQFEIGTAKNEMSEERRQHIEDEANAFAGRLMREYGQLDDTIYESADLIDKLIAESISTSGIKGSIRVSRRDKYSKGTLDDHT